MIGAKANLPPLEKIIENIHEISSLPHIAMRVMEVVGNPNSAASDLKAVVETDPSLTARLLRTVNSAAYALRTQVTNVQRAISLIGFNETRNLAVTASIADIFKRSEPIGSYNRPGLWKHMVCVGLTARMISARCGMADFEEAFLAGLLHDFGVILIDQYLHPQFVEMLQEADTNATLEDSERAKLGFDHTLLGLRMAEKWRFPPCTRSVIRYHHNSEACANEYQKEVRVVEVANFLCFSKKLSATGTFKLKYPSERTFAELSITREGLKVLWQDMDEEIAKSSSLINI